MCRAAFSPVKQLSLNTLLRDLITLATALHTVKDDDGAEGTNSHNARVFADVEQQVSLYTAYTALRLLCNASVFCIALFWFTVGVTDLDVACFCTEACWKMCEPCHASPDCLLSIHCLLIFAGNADLKTELETSHGQPCIWRAARQSLEIAVCRQICAHVSGSMRSTA